MPFSNKLQREDRPYKERLRNLLNNVHSVRIQTSVDNSCIFIERIEEVGSETDAEEEEEEKEHFQDHPRSIASINGEAEEQKEPSFLMIQQHNNIIKRLEKLCEEQKQMSRSGSRSPYGLALTSQENSQIMLTPNQRLLSHQIFKIQPLTPQKGYKEFKLRNSAEIRSLENSFEEEIRQGKYLDKRLNSARVFCGENRNRSFEAERVR